MHIGARYFELPVCAPCKVIVPLQVVGFVAPRPIGKSHFVPAPWSRDVDERNQCDYLPSKMTLKALSQSVLKAVDPLISYADVELSRAFDYLHQELSSMWFGDNYTPYAEAVELLNLEKSPGFPWYSSCSDKECALKCHGDKVMKQVEAVVGGEEMWLPFSLTLKDELRTAERVAAEKTRGFAASGLVHLLASKMMFSKQNEKIVQNIGNHPITLGVSVPGNQFVKTVLSLGDCKNCYDADGDGCDQRFNLSLARVIRDLRKSFLAENYHKCVDLLYDAVYAGDVIACGVVHRMLHNKSGWENTSMDNSLYMWAAVYLAVTKITGGLFSEVCRVLINGDDLAFSFNHELLDIQTVSFELARHGVRISFDNCEPRLASDITFLSHTLVERFVLPFGDVLIAAGNKAKLLSSLHWVKPSSSLSFEESCLAHLLGLRLCLWPWRAEFLDVEERIDSFLRGVDVTTTMRLLLKARITEVDIVGMHLRVEGFGFFTFPFFEVDQVTLGLIKRYIPQLENAKNGKSVCETQCRAAKGSIAARQGHSGLK